MLVERVAAALQTVRMESCRACAELETVGTDGCRTCETGRVTLYTQGTRCLECKWRGDAGRD